MNRDRFSGVFNASRWPVTLVGLGGIGSNLAVMLSKMGFNPLTLVDGDRVSEENTGTQLYEQNDVRDWKTAATSDRLYKFSPDTEVFTVTTYVEGDTPWYELALVTFCLAGGLVATFAVLGKLLGPRRSTPLKGDAFECGNPPSGSARERFPVRFYLIAILFIVFDVEVVLMYPWAVVFRRLGWLGFFEMLFFVAFLGLALLYVWRKGALEWD